MVLDEPRGPSKDPFQWPLWPAPHFDHRGISFFRILEQRAVGDRRNADRIHVRIRLHGRSNHLLPRLGAFIDPVEGKDDRAGKSWIQCQQHLCECHDQLPAQFYRLELEQPSSILLGWDLFNLGCLGVLPPARTQGKDQGLQKKGTANINPQGRTYAELDLLFEHEVPARKFAKTTIDPYSHNIVPMKRASTGTDDMDAMN